MEDGATSHTAQRTLNFLQAHRVDVLPLPSKSPALNPIKHMMDFIGRLVRRLEPVNVRPLQQFAMDRIPQRTCLRYMALMRSHCQAVIQANGDHIRDKVQ